MTRARNGFSLLEVLVGLAILAGPVLVAMDSLTASARASRFNANHLALEMLVTELADQLCVEAADRLEGLAGDAAGELVRELAEARIAAMPDGDLQAAARREVQAIRALELSIELLNDRDFGRMFRVVVSAKSMFGGIVRGVRLVQVPPKPPGNPPPPPVS